MLQKQRKRVERLSIKVKLKIAVLVFVLSASMVAVLFIKHRMGSKGDVYDAIGEGGVLSWVRAFAECRFSDCDDMVEVSSDRLYSPQFYSLSGDLRYYDTALRELVGSISAVQVAGVVKNTRTGVTEYTLRVTYDEYERIAGISHLVDEALIKTLKEAYIGGNITEADFKSELSDLYYNLFCESCFGNVEDTKQIELVLSEKDGFVYGTVGFIDSLLDGSNILANISKYEECVKDTVGTILRTY